MTVPNNLGDIITKFRRITAQASQSEISDAEIVKYINTFYIYDLPMHLPLFNMKETLTFYTSPNVDAYVFPRNTYMFIQPPVYIAGYQAFYSQSREQFFRTYPKFNFFEQAATGDGVTSNFSFTATQVPFLRANTNENNEITSDFILSSIDAVGNAIQIIDNGIGQLIKFGTTAPIVGSVNYVTGLIIVDFSLLNPPQIPANGAPINIQYVPYVAARPLACLFYQDQFFLRPVPNNVYQFQVDAWRYPTPIFDQANASADPQLNEWWQLLAYGAADKFFADNADFENLMKFRPLLQEQLKLINRRTIKQQTNQRSSTIYSDQIQFPYNNQFFRF
jgi:hypothetical protein